MGRIKNASSLYAAKCILNDYPPATSKFRGLDLNQFTSIELAKIVDMAFKNSDDKLMQPTKVESEFKEGDTVYYKGCIHLISEISGESASIRNYFGMTTQVVLLKDLKLDPEPVDYLPKQEPVSFQKGQRVWFKCDPYRISNVVGKDAKICNGNNTLCVKVKNLTPRD